MLLLEWISSSLGVPLHSTVGAVAVQSAYSIAFIQAASGAIYSLLINHIVDPRKRQCNPPGVLSLLAILTGGNGWAGGRRSGSHGGGKTISSGESPHNSLRSDTDQGGAIESSITSTTEGKNSSNSSRAPKLSPPTRRNEFTFEDATYQSWGCDANALFTIALLLVTIRTLLYYIPLAANDMSAASPLALQCGLFPTLIADVLGRCQRHERLKNAEGVSRWTCIVFPSFVGAMILGGNSPLLHLQFVSLVLCVRYMVDTLRTMLRIILLVDDNDDEYSGGGKKGKRQHRSALRGTMQLLWGCLVLPLVVGLTILVASSSSSS